jgi:hypothetical protein
MVQIQRRIETEWTEEDERNLTLQKDFVNLRLPETRVIEIEFRHSLTKAFLAKEQLFFFEGKWRNTDPNSEFSVFTFDENEIESIIYWS